MKGALLSLAGADLVRAKKGAISNKVLFANVHLESLADITARHIAAVVSVVSAHPETSSAYKKRLSDLPGLSHLTIEVKRCPSAHGFGVQQ